jgi:ankyrin repeat protein
MEAAQNKPTFDIKNAINNKLDFPLVETMERLLIAGADPNVKIKGKTIPHIILRRFFNGDMARENISNLFACFELFVQHQRFDVNSFDVDGNAIIHTAAKIKDSQFLRLLMTRCQHILVDLPYKNDDGRAGTTALHIACQELYAENVRVLLEDGRANPNIRDKLYKTPMQTVVEINTLHEDDIFPVKCEIMKLLLDHGGDANSTDFMGHTLLHFCQNIHVCKLLLSSGADPIFQGQCIYMTAIKYADVMSRCEIRDLMVKWVNSQRFRAIYQLLQKKHLPMGTLKLIHDQSLPSLY